jgi:magnesium-protoporphyrin O-methyltransferase
MLDPALGEFDHVVAMDSLIHYPANDIVAVLAKLASRCRSSVAFTFAPRTAALTVMHAVGQLLPSGDRSPAIEPVGDVKLRRLLAGHPSLQTWNAARTLRISRGFYISQALELAHG